MTQRSPVTAQTRSNTSWLLVLLIAVGVACAGITVLVRDSFITGNIRIVCLGVLLYVVNGYRLLPAPVTAFTALELPETRRLYWLTIGLWALPVLLISFRSLTDSPVHLYDEGIWSYIGNAWVHLHQFPYVGTVENKPPGIFYLFALGHLLPFPAFYLPRLLGIAAHGLTAWGVYCLGCRLRDRFTGLLAMAFYGLTTSVVMLQVEFVSATETFMLAGTVWAAVLLQQAAQAPSRRRYLRLLAGAGALLGVALTFKQIVLFTALGLFLFHLAQPSPHRRGWQDLLRDGALALACLLGAHLLCLLPMFLSGVSPHDYWQGAWAILAHSVSPVWRGSRLMLLFESPDLPLYLPIILLLVLLRGKIAERSVLVGIAAWFACDFVASVMSGTFFPHQLRQPLPALVLVAALTIQTTLATAARTVSRRPPALPALALLAFAALWLPGWAKFGIRDGHPDYYSCIRQTAAYLRTHSSPSDTVYVFSLDSGPKVLAEADRRAASCYFTQNFDDAPGVEARLRQDILINRPRYLVLPISPDSGKDVLRYSAPVPGWAKALANSQYQYETSFTYSYKILLDWKTDGFKLYRCKD